MDASSTVDTIVDSSQSLLDEMDINNDDINEGENAVGGGYSERASSPKTTETERNNTAMQEEDSNTNPPA